MNSKEQHNLPLAPDMIPEQGVPAANASEDASAEMFPSEAAAEKAGFSNRDLIKLLLRFGMMNQQRQNARRLTQQEYLSRLQFNSILHQAKELKKLYPDFDLAEELKNPVFARLLAPGVGLDLQTVYETIHHQQLKQAALRESGLMLTKAIQSGRTHPIENALDSRYFTAPLRTDPASLTPEERRDIRSRVMKGERVTF